MAKTMIEIVIKTNNPWRSVFYNAIERLLTGFGWRWSHVTDGHGAHIFIGVHN